METLFVKDWSVEHRDGVSEWEYGVLELAPLNEEVGKPVEIWSPTVTPCCLLAASTVPLTTQKAHVIADGYQVWLVFHSNCSCHQVCAGRR